MTSIRLSFSLFCLSFLLLTQCSEAQNLIEISTEVHLQQIGQELVGHEVEAEYGRRVAINELGDILVVTSREAGEVVVYRLEDEEWKPMGQSLSCEYCNWFGFDVDLSDDGQTVAIGSESEGVFVFQYEKDSWVPKGEPFLPEKYGYGTGRTVELSGDGNSVAFAAYGAESDKRVIEAGAVYVLAFENNTWVPKGNTLYGDLAGHQMGYGMSFSRNGERLVISSPYHAYRHSQVFELNNNNWEQVGNDINSGEGKNGWHLEMNDSGDKIFSYNSSSYIHLYEFQDEQWEEVVFQEENTKFTYDYGYGFAFVPFSKLVLLANPSSENENQTLGKLFFFDIEQKETLAPIGSLQGTDNKNYFGYHLDVSSNGKVLVVGSMADADKGLGVVKVFEIIEGLGK